MVMQYWELVAPTSQTISSGKLKEGIRQFAYYKEAVQLISIVFSLKCFT